MKKPLTTLITVIFAGLIIALGVRFIYGGAEDNWRCENGQWVKHGQPSAPQPTTGCGTTNNNTNSAAIDTATATQDKNAIVAEFTDFAGFEQSTGFAGHSVVSRQVGADRYYAFITLGSGVPIAQATCFRVDNNLVVEKIGEYPGTGASSINTRDINPVTCAGIN